MLKWCGPVLVGFGLLLDVGDIRVRLKLIYWRCLANDDVVSKYLNSWANDSIFVEFVISTMLPS